MLSRRLLQILRKLPLRTAVKASANHHRSFRRPKLAIESLESRVLMDASPVNFDFEDQVATSKPNNGAYEVLSMTKSGLTLKISRPGSCFDVVANTGGQNKPSVFGARSLDPFCAETSDTPFVFNFSAPVSDVTMLMGDYGQDSPDNLLIEAFSGPNATGTRIDVANGSLPTLSGDAFNHRQLAVSGSHIRSLRVIGGTSDYPNSTYVDRIIATPEAVGVDLSVSIDSDAIVPVNAPDLNLNHIWAKEKLFVPVIIDNQGATAAKGKVTISVFLSTSPQLTGDAVRVGKVTASVNLGSESQMRQTVLVTVPGKNLNVGADYYFIAQITGKKINEGNLDNNVAATDRAFYYLGKPKNSQAVENGTYFRIVRETLLEMSPTEQRKGNADVAARQSVARATEESGFAAGSSLDATVVARAIVDLMGSKQTARNADLTTAMEAEIQSILAGHANRLGTLV